MSAVDPARISLLLSLVVLGISLAAFASATGITASETRGEFAIADGAFAYSTGDESTTVVDDAGGLERIEITDEDGHLGVTTRQLEVPELDEEQRDRATRVAMSNETIAENLGESGGAAVTVVPILEEDVPFDRTNVATLDPDRDPTDRLAVDRDPEFRVERSDADGTVVLERNGPRMLEDRALVVVDPVDERAEYRAVVDLEAESVDLLLRTEFVVR